ncbi:hypothetical protein E2I00_019033, partial [Balaenoptera physalus]
PHPPVEAPPSDKELQAIKIQAWWRGTLVRRTLLHAALRACIIQYWWKQKLAELLEKKRRAVLDHYAQQKWAVVRLQSWDLVFPSETVGKRIRKKLDGSWLIKVHLDKAQQNNVEYKVETFSGVYKKFMDGNLILIVVEDSEEEIRLKQKQQQQKKEKNIKERIKAAKKIQAWWRGTLVRQTLLHAALRAWIIQCWWRLTMDRLRQKKRRAALISYAHTERAVVKLQSLVRMWRIHWRYCQVLNAIYIIQYHWQCHNCQTCALLRGHCVVTATHLQFHIEIINP